MKSINLCILILLTSNILAVNNNNCPSCDGCNFNDIGNCVKILIMKRPPGYSTLNTIKYLMKQQQIKYQYFKRCKDTCCSNDTISYDLIVDSTGNVININTNENLSKYKDTIHCSQLMQLIKTYNFGSRCKCLLPSIDKNGKPDITKIQNIENRKLEFTLVFMFKEPNKLRFSTPLLKDN